MLTLALAYSIEDEATARRIAEDLDGFVHVEALEIGGGVGDALLAALLERTEQPTLLLVSEYLLTNPNAMYAAEEFLPRRADLLPVYVRSRRYDAELEEIIVSEVLLDQDSRAEYERYWIDTLHELAATQEGPDIIPTEPFRHFTVRVRGIRDQIGEALNVLAGMERVGEDELDNNDYAAVFELLDDTEVYRDFTAHRRELLRKVPNFGTFSNPTAGINHKLETQGTDEPESMDPFRVDSPAPATESNKPVKHQGTDAGAKFGTEHWEGAALVPSSRSRRLTKATSATESETLKPDEIAPAWIKRAWTLHDDGSEEAGLELLGSSKEALPDYPDLAYNYALMLAMTKDSIELARAELEVILEEFHDHAPSLFLSGELALAMGDIQSAHLDWLQLMDTDQYYPELNYRLGVLLMDHFAHKHGEALTYLRRASRDDPDNGDARYRYGMLLHAYSGSTKKSIKWLKRAVEASPDHAAAHYGLATLLHQKGKLTAARNAYRTACDLDCSYETPTNKAAFTKKRRAKASTGNRGTPGTERLKAKIQELEARLEAYDGQQPERTGLPDDRPGAGKVAFITGATAGIGRATATALAESGFNLLLLGRRQDRLEQLRTELAVTHNIEVHTISADVRDREGLHRSIAGLAGPWREIDLLINNAGKAKGYDPIHQGDYAHWDEMIDVNLKGLLNVTREVSPLMVNRGGGTIINVCSTAGKEVYANGNVYCATKHAVNALTYAMRLDLVRHGIRVGQVCPAHVEETEFALVRFDGDTERAKIYEDFQPLRSRDVARAIVWMATQPRHVNVMDVVLQGTQQASSTVIDRSGRERFAPND